MSLIRANEGRKLNNATRYTDINNCPEVLYAEIATIQAIYARRGGIWEIGIAFIIFGVAAFYYRYYSDWSREYFTPGQVEMSGDAPIGLAFVGELI